MKPPPFDYRAPETLAEAVALVAEFGEDGKLLAGGQSLIPVLALRLASPRVLIDLNGVAELEYERLEGDRLVIGAMSRQRSVRKLPGLARRCAAIAEGIDLIGHVAIRNRGTVGGSVAHADPAAEWPALLLVLDGEIDVAGPRGTRTVAAPAFFESFFTTVLAPDEIVTEVRVTIPGGRSGSTFLELARRHGDFAIAGAVAAVTLSERDGTIADARVGLIGVAPTAVRATSTEEALRGARPTGAAIADAAALVGGHIDPASDIHGSADYRRQAARVLTRRALTRATERAAGSLEGSAGLAG